MAKIKNMNEPSGLPCTAVCSLAYDVINNDNAIQLHCNLQPMPQKSPSMGLHTSPTKEIINLGTNNAVITIKKGIKSIGTPDTPAGRYRRTAEIDWF